MAKIFSKLPLRTIFIVPFVLQIVGTVGLVGYLSFKDGQKAVEDLATRLMDEISHRIEQNLRGYLEIPHQINQTNLNAVRLGLFSMQDLDGWEKYLWQQVQQYPNITYIGVGNVKGEYRAAEQLDNGLMRINVADRSTNYGFYSYNTNESGDRTTLATSIISYRLLKHSAYQQTVKAGKEIWTPLFISFNEPTLLISSSKPVYDEQDRLQGILQATFRLERIGQFLSRLKIGQSGQAFIIDRDGTLIATSTTEKPFWVVEGERRLFKATKSNNRVTQATARYLTTYFKPGDLDDNLHLLDFKIDNRPYFLQVLPFKDSENLDWKIVVAIPESDFMAQITANTRKTILLCLGALAVAIIIGIFSARWVTQPILRLNTAAKNIARGNLDEFVPTNRTDELGELAKAFNSMAQQLKDSFAALETKNKDLQRLDSLKDEFLANTSHELRTPIYGMVGIAESMLDNTTGQLSELQTKNLSIIVQSGYRLANLVNDILDFSKLRHQDIELQQKPVDLRAIAEIVLTLSQSLVGDKKLQLINAISNDLPLVKADENRLQQIFYNLVGNAIKFTHSGEVTVTAKLVDSTDFIAITVSDTGIGIPEDKLDYIFESFEQADGSISREYGGTGLGLAITKKLVELHGGEIIARSRSVGKDQSRLNEGAKFTFTLPISSAPIEQTLSVPAFRESINFSVLATSKTSKELALNLNEKSSCNILVVDDEPVNLQVLVNHLSRYNYKIIQASNGEEALTLIEDGYHPDLILLDVMMPRITGYEVTREIRKNFSADRLPIILLSAKNRIEDLVLGLEAGANDYLTKPIDKNELLARLRTYLLLKQLEQETIKLALENQQQLVQFLEAMPVGVVAIDGKESFYYLNQKAVELFGSEELYQQKFEQLAKQIYLAGTSQLYPLKELPIFAALKGEDTSVDNIEIYREDKIIPIESWAKPIYNGEGNIIYAIAVFQDITERKKLYSLLQEYNQDLEHQVTQRTQELVQKNNQLEQEIQERQKVEQNLQKVNEKLYYLANFDELTQVANRRYFNEYLAKEWLRARREQKPLSLILGDVDYFKPYNDTYGHPAGDICLQKVAKALSQTIKRPADLVARYGGEEFVIILPNTNSKGAIQIAQNIQIAIRELKISHKRSQVSEYVTLSMGISVLIPPQNFSSETLINTADRALYEAKKQGRDRIISNQ
ncbi:MAG: diguanylate cyclase [Hydrococcus sp. Prado102]|jgi:diguanylate cyclase (GGDEF)-like protein/PAS domain S-box-containing protein|nr:diguanylate cyclase [Hydrococcus sp. Prado102]